MTLLLDTHLLLWLASDSPRLTAAARETITARRPELAFSAASIWEIAIKSAQGRPEFTVDARALRSNLLKLGFAEFEMTSAHGLESAALPPIHRDPFDRILVGQARIENATLLTADPLVARYGPPARLV